MIQRYISAVEAQPETTPTWKTILSNSQLTTAELLQLLELDHHPLAAASAESLFALRVPAPYLAKIRKGDPHDPLLLQVLPQSAEHIDVPGFDADPLDEKHYTPVPGLIHKYQSRVLLITTQACAIHCRYCFRRSFPYAEHRRGRDDWQAALHYLAAHPEVNEVILSGGDPLMMSNTALAQLLEEIDQVPTITRIRIHSRLLSSLPQRVDEALLSTISQLSTKVILVTHCNHPNEIDQELTVAAEKLCRIGVTLLNQSVLLKHINDQPETLAELSEKLFNANILPYYLFTLDRVVGTHHFELKLSECKHIYRQLLALLPGYLVPKLMTEVPGCTSKTPVSLQDL